MTTKGTNNDTMNWLKNITTWALLGIAGYQFSSLTGKVEKVHELVIKHDADIQHSSDEINRIRNQMDKWYESNRTQISQNINP